MRRLTLAAAAIVRTRGATDSSCAMAADRLRGALWGLFAGDAVASPTHWYYGGERQVRGDYNGPITTYIQPKSTMAGSIMPKSNTDGAGRGSYNANRKTVIGDVINHGKKPYWDPAKSHHYHATLRAGEETLEASLVRVLLRTVASSKAVDADAFRNEYVQFMQTPGSHNDSYASTAHRMFFANLFHKQKPVKDCPDNDAHNVDTIDGLVLPSVAAACAAYKGGPGAEGKAAARDAAVAVAATTRASRPLATAAAALGDAMHGAIHGVGTPSSRADAMASALGMRVPRQPTMVS